MIQQAMLCGDEVKAVIADIGTSHCRFGTAGQDVPHHVFRSELGVTLNDSAEKVFGDYSFRCLSNDMDIRRWNSGDKWDHWEDLLRHGVCDRLKVELDQYPIMLALDYNENNTQCKMKIMEMCFEHLSVPALYLSPSSMLSSFSLGRPTSLVIDLGASGTTVTPIVDGYQLRRSVIHTQRGGDMLDTLVRREVEEVSGIKVNPWFDSPQNSSMFKTRTTPFSQSFREFHSLEVIRDIKHWMCLIPNRQVEVFPLMPWRLPPPYELPDGTFVNATEKLSLLPETLFFPGAESDLFCAAAAANRKRSRSVFSDALNNDSGSFSADADSLTSLIYYSVSKCDVDARKEILNNILLVGGGSNIDGLSRRITADLTEVLPSHLKAKVTVGLPQERQNAAWIGGSILSICGTFQQLWLTKAEYEEQGGERACDRFER